MKRLMALLFSLYSLILSAQLHDAQWICSDMLTQNPSIFDFRQSDTVIVSSLTQDYIFPIFITSADICDENGDLLFLTNGINIYNKYAMRMEPNTTIISDIDNANFMYKGLNIPEAAVFLPKPGNNRYYYLVHYANDNNDPLLPVRPQIIRLATIDKEGNSGLGIVTNHQFIMNGPLLREGGMVACKHANGQDWWIVVGLHQANTFAKLLISSDTITGPFYQSIGPTYSTLDVTFSTFSPDGSKYATGTWLGNITLLDFDRCTGEFSNPIEIYNTRNIKAPDPYSGILSLAFSANSRFLYALGEKTINQYDLWSSNIQDSILVAQIPDSLYSNFFFMQLAANGKIYISPNGDYGVYHVINSPDNKGDSCNFNFRGFTNPVPNPLNVPYMPNYKLGSLIGSSCDTLYHVGMNPIHYRNVVNIQPNPAKDYVYVEIGKCGIYNITLYDKTGRPIQTAQTQQITIFNTENLSDGTYIIAVVDIVKNTLIQSTQVVIQH